MDIAAHIGELVLEHECVIIPGLGAFITNYSAAEINNHQLNILPPSRKLVFNASLVSNDGLLAHYISQKAGISYKTSLRLLELFVDYCFRDLTEGKQIAFGNLGVLDKNKHQKLEFYPNSSFNYNEDAFGLKPINFRKLIRKPDFDLLAPINKLETKPRSARILKMNTLNLRKIAAVLIPLAIFSSLVYYFPSFISNQNSNLTSIFSFLDNIKLGSADLKNDKTIVLQNDQDADAMQSENAEGLNTGSISEENFEKVSDISLNNEIIVKEQFTEILEGKYHVICGSFNEKSSADELVKSLREEGFSAYIAGQSNSGFYRVSMQSFERMDDAESQMQWIRFHGFKNAWILKKNFN